MKVRRGFTLFEFVLVISIVAILAGLFLSRVPYYQEQAEKTVMEQIVAAIQRALILHVGSLMTHGKANDKELSALASDNPMNWLQQKPKNYAGEFFDPNPATVVSGNWMFDLKSHDLIYVLNRSDYFIPGKGGQKWIRFHVKLIYESAPGNQANEKEALVSVLFEPVETYHWFD